MTVKVFHLLSDDINSGAGKGVLRLHQGLLELGVDSWLVGFNYSNTSVLNFINISNRINRIKRRINIDLNKYKIVRSGAEEISLFNTGNEIFNIFSSINFSEEDIVHLHWINNGISIKEIYRLSLKLRLIWTIRDMWPFTGGCHYSLNCNNYKHGCGKCVALNSIYDLDISSKLHKEKMSAYSKIEFVAISEWLRTEAISSGLVTKENISTIYNSVDERVFYPVSDRINIRARYGIITEKTIILFGAQHLDSEYKGGKVIRKILEKHSSEYYFIFFGNGVDSLLKGLKIDYKSFGFVKEEILADLYRLSDIFGMLSIQEAFGKTLIESLACGTPVITLKGGAPAEIGKLFYESHEVIEDIKDFPLAVEKLMTASCPKKSSKRCRDLFSFEKIATSYLKLYQNIL